MQRIAWRRVLPGVQFVLYLLLIWFGCPYRTTFQYWLGVGPLAGGNIVASWIDAPLSWQEQLATGFSFPAAFSEILLMPFDRLLTSGTSRELSRHLLMASCVPILWYFVGRSIDRRRLPNKKVESFLAKLNWGLALAVLVGMAGLVLVSILSRPHDFPLLKVLAFAWIVFGLRLVYARLRPSPLTI